MVYSQRKAADERIPGDRSNGESQGTGEDAGRGLAGAAWAGRLPGVLRVQKAELVLRPAARLRRVISRVNGKQLGYSKISRHVLGQSWIF